MGNDGSSHKKEKNQDFSIACLQDIYKFRLHKTNSDTNTSNRMNTSDKFQIKTTTNLKNPKEFLLFAETLVSEMNILLSIKQNNLSLYHTCFFPEISIESYDNLKIKTNKGDEEFFQTMNQIIHGYIENRDQITFNTFQKGFNIENFEKVLNNDSFVYNNLQTSLIEQNSKEVIEFPFSQDFDLEDYIKKETEKVKKSFTFKESIAKEDNFNQNNMIDDERELNLLKNKYLEQSLKIKRKSVVSGDNHIISRQFMASYRSQNTKKPENTQKGSHKLLYPKVKQTVKLQVKNPTSSIVSTKNNNSHFRSNQFANIRTYEEIMNDTKKTPRIGTINNRPKSKINNPSKNLNPIKLSESSVYSPKIKSNNNTKVFHNKSVSKPSEIKKPSGGISLRIDIRKLMDDDLFKEETEF